MTNNDPTRGSELAKIHIAAHQLGLDDTVYRMILRRVSFRISGEAKESAALMTKTERRAIIEEFKSRGWRERAAADAGTARDLSRDPAHIRKLRACWLDLKLIGALRDTSERALRAFVESRTGISDARFLTAEQANMVIESLKRWRMRLLEGDPGAPRAAGAEDRAGGPKDNGA